MRNRGTGGLIQVKGSPFWYLIYYHNGRKVRESSKSESKQVAEKLLQQRLAESGLGVAPVQDVKNIRYEHVRDAWFTEHLSQGRYVRTMADGTVTVGGLNHLNKFFKGLLVTRIDADLLREFIAARRKAGAADPTIRRNLVMLRSMLNLARKEGKLRLADVPHFPMPKDSEPVGKYIQPSEFAAISSHLPDELKPFFSFMYHTGCRLGAAIGITWDMVSKDCGEIKIPGALMKAKEPLTIVLAGPGLEPLVKMFRKMFRTPGQPVFHTAYHRVAWARAVANAKLGTFDKKTRERTGPRIHDCRCSAAVNLVNAGVPEDIVMKIGGWKTRAMFSRYNVLNTDRIRAAMELGGRYVAQRMKKQA